MRVNHPDAGRYDSAHPDDEPRGPVLTGATVAALDDEVDRLTAERDMLMQAMLLIMNVDAPNFGLAFGRCVDIATAALAKLEDES